jgi:fatty-acyl-CoA synthase
VRTLGCEAGLAVLVVTPGADRDPGANRTALRERLADCTVARLVEFAGAVSKTAAGKIRKPGSRDHYALTKENPT